MSKRVRGAQFGFLIGLLFLALTFSALQTNRRTAASPLAASAQQQSDDEDQERQLFAKEFLQARSSGVQKRTQQPQRTTGRISSTTDASPSMLGITLWRLRPADKQDETQARLLEQESDSEVVLIGERVGAETRFQEGQKVRLGVESPRNGYLYVIDREQYADGTYSEPYLIFPTLKTRGGDNSVVAGRLVEIPDQDDRPFYFKMNRHRPDQTGEVLTFLVTPQPIPNLELSRKALKLTNEQFAQWEQKWKAPTRRVELANHAGKAYTKTEMSAGANKTTLLGPSDLPPQIIFRLTGKTTGAVMVTLPLIYSTSSAKQ
jgi:hypothetical protein